MACLVSEPLSASLAENSIYKAITINIKPLPKTIRLNIDKVNKTAITHKSVMLQYLAIKGFSARLFG